MWILLGGAVQPFNGKPAEAKCLRLKRRVLAGEDEPRRKVTLGERMRKRCQFNCFRPGPDDQPHIDAVQPCP